jgi:hypothetical protein
MAVVWQKKGARALSKNNPPFQPKRCVSGQYFVFQDNTLCLTTILPRIGYRRKMNKKGTLTTPVGCA